jgi:hypothetical protein
MKGQYFAYFAEGRSEQSIDAVAKAISRFETYIRYKDFKAFHIEQAKALKRNLADQRLAQRRAAEQGDALRHPDRSEISSSANRIELVCDPKYEWERMAVPCCSNV